MITRRKFLKRLGQATILAMASPAALAGLVKASDPVEEVLGPILNTIKLDQLQVQLKRYLILPAKEYDLLEEKTDVYFRFSNEYILKLGYDNLVIKGIAIVRGK